MTKQGRSWLAAGVLLAVVLLGLSTAYRCRRAPPPAPTMAPEQPPPVGIASPMAPRAAGGSHAPLAVAKPKGQRQAPTSPVQVAPLRASTKMAVKAPGPDVAKDPQIRILDDLLDGDDNAATLAQARRMAASPKAAVRSAALDALRWLGGHDAASELAGMLSDADPDIAAAAAGGLLSVLDELDDPALTAATLEQAIPKAAQDGAVESLFLSLSGLPEATSVPVLLNLLESKVAHVSALAKEYLEFVTGGQEITNRAQGEAWLRENE